MGTEAFSEADWLGFCRRAAEGARAALERHPTFGERARQTGRGEGGDIALAIDRAAEDAVFEQLDALGVGLCAISEERGHVEIAGGGPATVVIDPIDGSLNAKRSLPGHCISIAVAHGDTMGDVDFGYVRALGHRDGQEWWARRGEGAWFDGERLPKLDRDARLEILGVESAHPRLVAGAAAALAGTSAHRLRMLGSIALSLCNVASARFDGLISLREARSVDAAAGQLIVREAGGAIAFPDAGDDRAPLSLDMRSRVVAAASPAILGELLDLARKVEAPAGG
jgi:myo-inositol-1(or 4)-monophosphatase